MIQHVVLINFRHGVPESVRHQCLMGLRELASLVPGLTNWRVGLNMTTAQRAWDMSVTGEFATLDDVAAYKGTRRTGTPSNSSTATPPRRSASISTRRRRSQSFTRRHDHDSDAAARD
jgi:hypothetical protein